MKHLFIKENNKVFIAIFITIFIIFAAIIIYYYSTIEINDKRHLDATYEYAHFSKINKLNFFLFPRFLFFTHPINITLKTGEGVYIPKNWWHWIITKKKTTAVNYWFSNKNNFSVIKIDNLFNSKERLVLLNKIEKEICETEICLWKSSYSKKQTNTKMIGNKFLNSGENNRYFITLDGYNLDSANNYIKTKLQGETSLPNFFINNNISNVDMNLWISSNYHDTGLHYDDNDGILYVLDGEKQITLYPPQDSKYLEPYNILPVYALQKPIFMYYNENKIINKNIGGNPSELILFKSVEFMALSKNVSKMLQYIYDIKIKRNKDKKLIWGCKKTDNIYRWEIYYYHYEMGNLDKIYKKDIPDIFIDNLSESIVQYLYNDNVIIHSIDILNSDAHLNKELHAYECDGQRSAPFYGSGYDIVNNVKKKVGNFIYDTQERTLSNIEKYLYELGLNYNKNILFILKKYNAANMCIWNKKGDYFIQWLTICVEDFISFLYEFSYEPNFIENIKTDKENYKNLSHEITIVFDKNTLAPIRTGFYGCL